MKKLKHIMGMPITVEVVDEKAKGKDIDEVFDYFNYIDQKFSTYKDGSEVSKIIKKEIRQQDYSEDMKTILDLSEQTKKETDGYFDVYRNGKLDPSGLVKGWAIWQASKILKKKGLKNFYIEAGGDIEASGKNSKNQDWTVGIRNPFKPEEIIKILSVSCKGIATSGTYERGAHIYNPKTNKNAGEIVSLTIIGPNIYEADRFATAAFAMGKKGINFIEKLKRLEGYMIDKNGTATYTSGLEAYFHQN